MTKWKTLSLGLLRELICFFVCVFWVIVLKEEKEGTQNPVDFSNYNLHLLNSLRMHGDDDEELRMLASLKREHEQDEYGASGLSASQIHQCDVSISTSSDDTSAWTHISTVRTIILCNSWSFCWFFTNKRQSCAAHPLFIIISRLSLFLSPIWNKFFWPRLILTLANFHFKPLTSAAIKC